MSSSQHDELLAGLDPTRRFSDRAADYVKWRPDYPAAAFDCMLDGLDPPDTLVAADVGAGTGISSRQLADRGVRVIAIEPNAAMRDAATPHAHVEWREGSAEATNLELESVDLVLAAQAFHWFRHGDAVPEFTRILRADGRLVVMWNTRSRSDRLTKAYIEAVHAVNGESSVEKMDLDVAGIMSHTGEFTVPELHEFPHAQRMPLEGFIGRAASASYVPKEGEAFERLKSMLTAIYEKFREPDGLVTMQYLTQVWRSEKVEPTA